MIPLCVQERRCASRLNSSGRIRIRRTASLPIFSRVLSVPSGRAGSTCATAPISRSDGLIGRLPGSVTNLTPAAQLVVANSFFGSGPRSRSKTSGERPINPRATPIDRFIRERRPRPAAPARSFTVATKSSRSASDERNS